jgi:hypothetical protein
LSPIKTGPKACFYSALKSAATLRLDLMLLEMLRVAGRAAASQLGAASAAALGS